VKRTSAILAALGLVLVAVYLQRTGNGVSRVDRIGAHPTRDAASSDVVESDRTEATAVYPAVARDAFRDRTTPSSDSSSYDRPALDRLFANALTNPNLDDRRLLLRGVADFLARNDPSTGRDYLISLLHSNGGAPNSDAQVFTQEFAASLAKIAPKTLVALSTGLPESLGEITFQFAAREFAVSHPREGANWIPCARPRSAP
jgi:hypothetical protein